MKTKIILTILLIGASIQLFAQVKENKNNVIVPNKTKTNKSPQWSVGLSMDKGPIVITTSTNPTTNKPWDCIAADGASSVRIDISAPGYNVSYNLPEKDGIITTEEILTENTVVKEKGPVYTKNGKASIYFHPPKNIPEENLFYTKNLSQNRILRYYKSEITFTLRPTLDPRSEEIKFNVNYFRPPVFLVHGFTGDKSTWELLDRLISQKGFITHRENYYMTNSSAGEQDIYSQAKFLGDMIRLEMNLYAKNNVMFRKVDIVAHSMGGLIARYYTKLYPNYAADVRKIIMVGTPNHGIYNFTDRKFGEVAAYFSDSHKGMAKDVSSDQPIMIKMNQGEKNSLNHLNNQIEYGNIYVEGTDGVVEGRSARVNGIQEMLLTKMKHSPAIPSFMNYGSKSITTDFTVFSKIIGWLNNPIAPAKLNMNKWAISEEISVLQKVDLSGQGHILKVHMGVVRLKSDLKRLECLENTQAEIIYPDGTELKLLPNTKIAYNNDFTELVLTKGRTILNIRKQKKQFIVITPTLRAGVRGTSFEVVVDDNQKTDIYLYDGELDISNTSESKIINSGQTIQAFNENRMNSGVFDPENRFNHQLAGKISGMSDFASFAKKINPLFTNVTTGGEIIKAPPGGFSKNSSAQNSDVACNIDEMKPSFYHKMGAVGNNPQAQMIIRMMDDHNKRELYWFNDAKKKFKLGILPLEIKGTYTKKENPNISNTEYYSQTVTLFQPMKVVNVIDGRYGFSLSRNMKTVIETQNSNEIKGTILQCGSYKIYPKTGSYDGAMVRLILEKPNGQGTTTNNSSTQTNKPPVNSGQGSSLVDQMHPQFQTPIGQVNSQQGQFIARKIDDQNRREQFWFNEDKKKFKQGNKPTEIYGTQVIKEFGSDPNYYCQTVTLFVPTKISNIEWDAMGYRILKDGKETKESWLKKEMIGKVLQPGSYKLYPHLKALKKKAWVKIYLTSQ